MINTIKHLAYILLISFFSSTALAQEISVSASANRNTMALDEQLELNIVVSGNVSDLPNLQLPQIANFTSYSSGRTQNMSIINGQISSSISFKYVLVPQNTGKFTIPPFSMQYNNQSYSTQPINIEVGPAQGGSSASTQGNPTPSGTRPKTGSKDIFITASVDKNSVYVNDQITYTFKFFQRVRLLSNPQYKPPDLSGFWIEDTPPKNYYTTLEGSQYLVTEVKMLLFPTKSGKFTISPATLQCKVEDFNPADISADSFFDNFFSGGKVVTLKTNTISVNVLAVPENGKPSDFAGSVGSYSMSAEIDKKTTKVNEAVTLSITISGNGNIKTISEPKLPDWTDFRKYETVSTLNISKENGVISGSKTFKTIIVPTTPGEKKVPPVSFTYFDPLKKQYIKLSSQQLVLDVKPGAPGQTTINSQTSADAIKLLNQDISYLKTLNSWKKYPGPLYKNIWFILLNILPLSAIIFTFIFSRYQNQLEKDIAGTRHSRASSTARKYLKKAASLIQIDKAGEFYFTLSRSLLQYIADKTNLSAEGLTSNAIEELLLKRGISNETIESIKCILSECDLVRFAPSQVTFDMMQKAYNKVGDIIDSLEKGLRKR